MKLIQLKYIISILSVAAIAIWGYTTTINTDIGHEGVKLADTVMVSSEAVERDTLKRLESLGNSGSVLTVSPFGSGKPMTEEPKSKFQKPNTEWKSRTISGVTYVFGEGNPKEVALPESEMKGCSWQEEGIPECTDKGAGYVDADLEKLIYDMLNSPDWESLIKHCEEQFRDTDSIMRADLLNNGGTPSYYLDFDRLTHLASYISLEDIIVINNETGRKNISKESYAKLMFLRGYLLNSTWFGHANADVDIDKNYSKCVDNYGTSIINALTNIRSLPWRGAKGE
jgi:hypothetical protein